MGRSGSYLDDLAVLVLGCLAEQRPHDEAEGIQLAHERLGNRKRYRGEEDELVVLAQVAQEVVDARPLGHTPAVLARPLAVHKHVLQADAQRVGSLERRIRVGQQFLEGGLLVVAERVPQPGHGPVPPEAQSPAIRYVRVLLRVGLVPVAAQVHGATHDGQAHGREHPVGPLLPSPLRRRDVGRRWQFSLSTTARAASCRLLLHGRQRRARGRAGRLVFEGRRDALGQVRQLGEVGHRLGRICRRRGILLGGSGFRWGGGRL